MLAGEEIGDIWFMDMLTAIENKGLSRNWRIVGLLPLAFFAARLAYFSDHGGISQILWLCHLSNLTLAIGLIFNVPVIIGISAYWLVLAIPFWLIDVFSYGLEGMTSAATHLGGLLIALLALKNTSPNKPVWHFAMGWYLIIQLVSRLFTPPELNINFSHAIYRGWEFLFANYAWYWILTSTGAGVSVYLLDAIRLRVFNHTKTGTL